MTELDHFRDYLEERIAGGAGTISPEEAVAEWRREFDARAASDLEAIREAVEELKAGERGVPIEEQIARLRGKIESAKTT